MSKKVNIGFVRIDSLNTRIDIKSPRTFHNPLLYTNAISDIDGATTREIRETLWRKLFTCPEKAQGARRMESFVHTNYPIQVCSLTTSDRGSWLSDCRRVVTKSRDGKSYKDGKEGI
ncbi:MAG: hypothetical protein A2017_08095 [Lentisphaerae bacterium GWF2_44_16]|nr:MAG: hypothetical protein A2017_08095 [Lentisphaerae bacterium GWF2_44_16]